jgi:hypothetical protein
MRLASAVAAYAKTRRGIRLKEHCDQFGVNSELSMIGIVASLHVPKNASTHTGLVGSLLFNQVEITIKVLSWD